MPSFKPKNSKKIITLEKNNTTLDGKHKEILNEFYKDENITIPKYIETRKNLEAELKKSDISIEKKLELTESIETIKKDVNKLKNKKKEYFLNNSRYIFDYFENKKNISEGISGDKNKTLNKFFNLKLSDKNNISNNTTNIQKYFTNINEDDLDLNNFCLPTDICNYCHKGEMIPIEHEGLLVCNNCSKSIKFLIENEKPSYKEPPKEVCFYAYKRINHFREILAQFQAKETTQIPNEVLENIKLQITKERIQLKQLTNKKAKEILKKLGYNKYYEHIPFIKDKLGIRPPIMSPELEETLCNLFMEIQGPYSKFCPDVRVNFLNYYYTVYKLCELLEQTEFLPYFPMLKDREKRIEQDEIWKKICGELDWEFIPTI